MKKTGFIDITEQDGTGNAFSLYIFRRHDRGYEFERTVRYDRGTALSIQPDEVTEFYLSIPLSLLNFRVLSLPFSDRDRLNKIIPFELENLTMASSDKIVFDAIVLGGSGSIFDVLVIYMEEEILKNILTRLSSLNIDPRIVTSIELRAAVGDGKDNIVPRLSKPGGLNIDERIRAAHEELSGYTINIRTGAVAYTKDADKLRKSLALTTALGILLALVINADLAFRIIKTKGEISSVRRDIRNMYSGAFPGEKKISDELYQMRSHMKDIQERNNALSGMNPLQFLHDLSQKTVQGVSLNEIGIERGVVTMRGEAALMDDISRMKAMLSGFLSEVSVSDIKPSVSGKQFFTVIAKGRR